MTGKKPKIIDTNTFTKIAIEIGTLVAEKQKAYGDSFGRSGNCLREMFPNGINPTQYDDVLTIARILDKLFRIATNPHALGENPFLDINGYSLLGYARYEKKYNTKVKSKRTTRAKSNTQRTKSSRRKIPNKRRRKGN